jgi:hypothetical protein
VGILFPRRTADTYDIKTDKKTHRTEMTEKGIIFPERVAETNRVNGADSEKIITRIKEKGIFFHRKVAETDKEK